MKILKQIIILCTAVIIISSCANVKPLTGGDKDIKPPYLTIISPPDSSLNFQSYNVVLTFDEFIALKSFNQEVKVNPYINPIDIKPTIKGKKVFLQLPKDLKPNTTYHIDFGNAITDIHESIPFDSLGYTFSTGSYIDTLKVEGTINSNGNTKSIENLTIALYTANDSITPTEDKPIYYTESKSGTFSLRALPNEEFQLYAFTDLNSNLLYDSLSEQLAFTDHSIYPSKSDSIDLTVFKESTTKFRFDRPSYKENYIEIIFSKGLRSITTEEKYLYNLKKNSLYLYPIDNNETVSFIAIDSFNHKIDTTFTVFESTALFTDSSVTITQQIDYTPNKPFSGIEITAEHKIKSYYTDSITVIVNGDTMALSESTLEHKLLENRNVIQFFSENETDTIMIEIPDKAITFLSDHYNEALISVYSPIDLSQYGQITGTIETTVPNYIVYLMDMKDNIISTDKNLETISYKYVKPGKYQIKVLIDENDNEAYDTGNLQPRRQPEAYYLYPKPIDLKANWEMGNINITF